MADNVAITAGTGTSIATDDVGGAHFQKVKLIDGTADSSAAIPGDATNGLDVDVTRLPALPAGTNNIGDVDVLTLPALPAGTNNIGDVDVLTLPALPAGTNNIGDVDVASGPTGASALQGQGAAAHDDAVAGNPVLAGGYASAAAPTDVSADGDAVRTWHLRNGAQATVITAAGALVGGDATNGLDVDVTRLPALPAGTNNIGDVDVLTLPALPAGTNNIGDVDVLTVPAPLSTTGGGTEATALRVTLASDSTGLVSVDDNGASLTVDGTVSAVAAGDVAHDGADSGNPVKVGYKAIAHGANPTAVAANDRTDAYANRHGIPFTLGGHPNIITRTVHIADADGAQTNASMVGTIAAGTKVAVTHIMVTVDQATTAATAVKIGFGATTLPADSATGVDGVLLQHAGIAPGSGVVKGDGSGLLGIGADGEELRLTCEDPAGGALDVTFSYFTIES